MFSDSVLKPKRCLAWPTYSSFSVKKILMINVFVCKLKAKIYLALNLWSWGSCGHILGSDQRIYRIWAKPTQATRFCENCPPSLAIDKKKQNWMAIFSLFRGLIMLPKTSCRIKEFCCLAGFTIQPKVVDIDKKKSPKTAHWRIVLEGMLKNNHSFVMNHINFA